MLRWSDSPREPVVASKIFSAVRGVASCLDVGKPSALSVCTALKSWQKLSVKVYLQFVSKLLLNVPVASKSCTYIILSEIELC